jgi:hypothetical protein
MKPTFFVTRWSYTVEEGKRFKNKRPDASSGPYTESEAIAERARQEREYPETAVYTWNSAS